MSDDRNAPAPRGDRPRGEVGRRSFLKRSAAAGGAAAGLYSLSTQQETVMAQVNGSGDFSILEVRPTVFFRDVDGALRRQVAVRMSSAVAAACSLRVDGPGWVETCPLGELSTGESQHTVFLPDLREPARLAFTPRRADRDAGRTVALEWVPGRHWHVYVTQRGHFDPGYTDLPSNVMRDYVADLDNLVRFADATADWPDDARFRFTIEQAWILTHYLRVRGPERAAPLLDLLRGGRIEVNAFFANMTTELMGAEEMARLVYPAFAFKRRYGVPILTAEHNDIPGMSWSLVTLMARAGIRYFAPGLPDYFRWGTQYPTFWDEEVMQPGRLPRAFHWEGPTGERVLVYLHRQGAGGDTDYTLSGVGDVCEGLEREGYPHESLRYLAIGGSRDNAPPVIDFAEGVRSWNERWAYPRLICATNLMFFRHLERELSADTPVFRGELPGTDYPVGALSTAKETGLCRITHDQTPAAERFATVAAALSDYPYQRDYLDQSYESMLCFDEHAWGMAHTTGPAQEAALNEKAAYAYRAAALTHDVQVKALNSLVDQIAFPDDAQYVVVFNPLCRRRTDLAQAFFSPHHPCGRPMFTVPSGPHGVPRMVAATAFGRNSQDLAAEFADAPFRVVDVATGETVPHQVVRLVTPYEAVSHGGARFSRGNWDPGERVEVHFVASDVPALGYKVYRFEPCEAPAVLDDGELRLGSNTLENRWYRVTLDPETGAVASILEKGTGREWVDSDCRHGFHQVVARNILTGEEEVAGAARIEPGKTGPVSISLVAYGDAPGCPQRTQEIILHRDLPRIDVATRLLKDADASRELFLAFPFRVDNPRFHYETPFAVVEFLVDQLPGTCSDYATVQHWADVSDGQAGVAWCPIESHQAGFGNLWPGYVSQAHHGVTPPGFVHPFETDPRAIANGHIYSHLMNNNFRTNFYPAQIADAVFRYSFRPHEGDWRAGDARAFGWETACPLMPVNIRGPREGALPASEAFIRVDHEALMLLALKRAEDGDEALILRFIETRGEAGRAAVTIPWWRVRHARRTNIAEEPEAETPCTEHAFEVAFAPWDVVTVRVEGMPLRSTA